MFIGISENDGINPAHIINYDYTDAQPAGTDENGQPYAADPEQNRDRDY